MINLFGHLLTVLCADETKLLQNYYEQKWNAQR